MFGLDSPAGLSYSSMPSSHPVNPKLAKASIVAAILQFLEIRVKWLAQQERTSREGPGDAAR